MSREFFVMISSNRNLIGFFTALAVFFQIVSFTHANEKQINLVVFGDSLVAGYGLAPGEAFPEKLQIALKAKGCNIEITNAGVSGDTTSAGLARLDWSIPEKTNAVILELGANDALRGIPAKITRNNLVKMVERLKKRNIKILLAGMMSPPNMGQDYANEFNPIFEEIAQQQQIALYPFFLDGVAGQTNLNQADAMHPTSKGVDVIVEKILPDVEKFLSSLKPS